MHAYETLYTKGEALLGLPRSTGKQSALLFNNPLAIGAEELLVESWFEKNRAKGKGKRFRPSNVLMAAAPLTLLGTATWLSKKKKEQERASKNELLRAEPRTLSKRSYLDYDKHSGFLLNLASRFGGAAISTGRAAGSAGAKIAQTGKKAAETARYAGQRAATNPKLHELGKELTQNAALSGQFAPDAAELALKFATNPAVRRGASRVADAASRTASTQMGNLGGAALRRGLVSNPAVPALRAQNDAFAQAMSNVGKQPARRRKRSSWTTGAASRLTNTASRTIRNLLSPRRGEVPKLPRGRPPLSTPNKPAPQTRPQDLGGTPTILPSSSTTAAGRAPRSTHEPGTHTKNWMVNKPQDVGTREWANASAYMRKHHPSMTRPAAPASAPLPAPGTTSPTLPTRELGVKGQAPTSTSDALFKRQVAAWNARPPGRLVQAPQRQYYNNPVRIPPSDGGLSLADRQRWVDATFGTQTQRAAKMRTFAGKYLNQRSQTGGVQMSKVPGDKRWWGGHRIPIGTPSSLVS
jgi:hypothetical protein